MISSLTVFLSALGFVFFGYLSFVRMMGKQRFPEAGFSQFFRGMCTRHLLSNLGSSAFFVSLPATSLLLFWGWGPALLWLIIFHLVVETLCHLQFSAQANTFGVADHLLRSRKPITAAIEQGLIQAFFLMSMGLVTALMATLIDRQSGLLFAILFLLPARALLRHPSAALPIALRVIACLSLLALGLAFSNQLGFSLYGDWAPFGKTVGWLRFNNPTIIAAVLTVAVFQLEKDAGFKADLSTFAGVIILLLVISMQIQLIIAQPQLDAPMNSAQAASEKLPLFMLLSLFVFAGFAALLLRMLNEEDNFISENIEEDAREDALGTDKFGRLQAGGMIHFVFMLLLGLSLASALGIGAWKTHYITWDESLNILDHLNLALSSTLHLISTQPESDSVLHTVLLAWLLIGALAWILATQLMLGMTLTDTEPSIQRNLLSLVTLILLLIGSVQLMYVIVHWFFSGAYLYVACASLLFLITALLWWRSLPELFRSFGQNSNPDLF